MIVDLFAGPGGWDEALRMLGNHDNVIGYEWDEAACLTAEAAGHQRQRGDLATMPVNSDSLDGLIASPPCQAWSTAGKGLGKLDQPRILAHLARIRDAGRWLHYSREGWHDPRSPLVLEPVRWALEGDPAWIACEQVPAVLPFWEAFGEILGDHGYVWDAGILSAERYGVPQTRKRAILTARRRPLAGMFANYQARLPAPTHAAYRKNKPTDPALPRWVSMAEALGWANGELVGFPRRADGREAIEIGGEQYRARDLQATSLPAQVLTEKARSWVRFGNQPNSAIRADHEPAATLRYSARASAVDWVMTPNNRLDNATVRTAGEPAATITGGHDSGNRQWIMNGGGPTGLAPRELEDPAATVTGKGTGYWVNEAPATTVQGDPRIAPRGHHDRQFNGDTVRVTVQEAAVLQSFRPDYPWQGTKTKQYEQVGNAIPPLLAAAILGNLLDRDWHHIAYSMTPEDRTPAELRDAA